MESGRIKASSPITSEDWKAVVHSHPNLEAYPERTAIDPFTKERVTLSSGKAYYVENGKRIGNVMLKQGEIVTIQVPQAIGQNLAQLLNAEVVEFTSSAAPSKIFPASLAYDPDWMWWSTKIAPLAFAEFVHRAPSGDLAAAEVELVVDINRRQALAGIFGPTAAQEAAYSFHLQNAPRTIEACLIGLGRIVVQYRSMFEQLYSERELQDLLPEQTDANAIKRRVRLTQLRISTRESDGIACTEYHFNSSWDKEHGLMVVLHKDRIVYTGGSGDGWKDRP